jgi:2',3'-cyclic-nucleotide 2'-phosphodiesterase/3'-nucleotidase
MAEKIHVVVRGDKLPEIADRNGVTLEDLMKHNKIQNPHILWVGQKIKIPGTAKD